jgi:hypothetical protein
MSMITKRLLSAGAVAMMTVVAMGSANACAWVRGRFHPICVWVPVQVCHRQWVQTDPFGDGYWTPVCAVVYE